MSLKDEKGSKIHRAFEDAAHLKTVVEEQKTECKCLVDTLHCLVRPSRALYCSIKVNKEFKLVRNYIFLNFSDAIIMMYQNFFFYYMELGNSLFALF